jgi:hypothetical protein
MLGRRNPPMDYTKAMQAGAEGMRAYMEAMAKDKRLAAAHAQYLRNLYEALVKTGFSEEQSLHIVASGILPGAK